MNADNVDPVLTEAFSEIVLTLHRAISHKRIICVVSSRGVGFKFAAKRFALKHYLGIVYVNVEASPSFTEVFCCIDKGLSNIRFSDIDPMRTSIHMLTRKINERIHLYDKCLLILDNCNLTPGQLKYFIRFLGNFNKTIGLVYRISQNYYKELTGNNRKRKGTGTTKKWGDKYDGLAKVTDDWKEISDPTEDEIEDICKVHGVNDQMIIDDIITKCGHNLSQISKEIKRYLEFKQQKHETKKEAYKKGRGSDQPK